MAIHLSSKGYAILQFGSIPFYISALILFTLWRICFKILFDFSILWCSFRLLEKLRLMVWISH